MGLKIAGEIQGARALLSGGGAATNVSAFLNHSGTTFSATKHFCLPRAGSIVGLSCQAEAYSFSSAGTVTIDVLINAVVVYSITLTISAAGAVENYGTQTRGTDVFVAGDNLAIQVTWGTYVGYLRNFLWIVELQFDT